MIEFLIKFYLAFILIDMGLVILYNYLMRRELETKEIDGIIQKQVETEDKLRDEIRDSGKTQEEVENIISLIYNNIEVVRIALIIIPLLNILTFVGLMRSVSEIIEG